jgi:hypothetical protein
MLFILVASEWSGVKACFGISAKNRPLDVLASYRRENPFLE